MRSFLLSFLFLSLGFAALTDPNLSRRVLHERRSHIPPEWNLARRHDPSAILPLRFGLTQSNLDRLAGFLDDVSLPASPNYGKYWSAGKVASTFAPSRKSVDAVRDWLVKTGIKSHRIKLSSSGGWLQLNATVREAEVLLNATYHVYRHESGAEHVACESYHLPEHLVPHVDFVTPTVHFDARLPKRSGSRSGKPPMSIGLPNAGTDPKTSGQISGMLGNETQLDQCAIQITPLCIRALYGFDYEPGVPWNNSYGITEYAPGSYCQGDLDLFAQAFDPGLIGVSPIMVSIDGGALSTSDYHIESNLDLEYAMNLVTPQNVTLYQSGDQVEGASINNFLDAIDGPYCTFEGGDSTTLDGIYPDPLPGGYKGPEDCGIVKPSNVISTSYGLTETDLTVLYMLRQCLEFAKLALMGITMLFASGDWGVGGNGGNCSNPDGSQSPNGKIFNPVFPATCPYVTAVGATQITAGKTIFDPEDACEVVISSGGGFSNYFAIPEYQKDAVSWYLKENPPPYPGDIWNSTGRSRAYPDLSANGAGYVIANDGNFTQVYGTSASTPVLGAMLAMINDARIRLGKSPIGFINPLIYSAGFFDGFNDITNGTNPGCGTPGFNTSYGWDPVTGLGTPRFPVLLAKWMALP